jgi:hypothetical protein
MANLKNDIVGFIRDRKFLWPLLFIAFLAYAFTITHPSISIDDPTFHRFLTEGESIAQGRFGGVLLNALFPVWSFKPVFLDTLAVTAFMMASVLWCVLIKRASHDKINPWSYPVFATAMISYPMIAEINVFMTASLNVALCNLLAALVLLGLQSFWDKKNMKLLVWMVLGLGFVFSTYEAAATLFISGIMMLFLLDVMFGPHSSYKVLFNRLLIGIGVVLGAIILKYGMTYSLLYIYNLERSIHGATQIAWIHKRWLDTFINLVRNTFVHYGFAALYYYPVTVYVLTLISGTILFINQAIKKKNYKLFLFYVVFAISIFALAILQGIVTPYRANQAISLFTSFMMMLIVSQILSGNWISWLKRSVVTVIALLILMQAYDLNKWYYVDYLRYEEETRTMVEIYQYIGYHYGYDRPIVFTGNYYVSDNIRQYTTLKEDSLGGRIYQQVKDWYIFKIPYKTSDEPGYLYKYTQNVGNSVIDWGVNVFDSVNTELISFARMNGLVLKGGTTAMYNSALALSSTLPNWPLKGSITDQGAYILVHF